MADEERYIVTVEGKEHDFKVQPHGDGYRIVNESGEFLVDAERIVVGRYLMRFGSSSEEIIITPNGEELEVFLGGKQFGARVESYDMAELRKRAGASSGGVKDNVIKAPMPGLVLDVEVKPGDEIAKDRTLVIIEAMKMENMIKASHAGKIKTVFVERGQAVEKNDKLVELE